MKRILFFTCILNFISGHSQTQLLTVNNGFGSGNYVTGSDISILANPTPDNFIFERWETNATLIDTFCVATKVLNINQNTVVTPIYAPAPSWTHTSTVINGSNVYYYFPNTPANLKGLILFYHGSNGNGNSWFTKLENRTFLNYAVAKGYGVLATESVDRISGGTQPWQWSNNSTIATNPDIQNIDAILNSITSSGFIDSNTKIFGVGFSQGSGFTSLIAALKNYATNSLGATPGIVQALNSSTSPTYWMASRQDENADPNRLDKCITNYNNYISNGNIGELRIHEPFPVSPNRFWRIAGVDNTMSADIFNRLLTNGYLDSNNYINFNPDANTSWKSIMQPTYNSVLDEIEDQVIICYTEHKFHSDQMYYIIKFFDQFANNVLANNEYQLSSNIIVYPNPFSNKIYIKNTDGNEEFILTNSIGQIVFTGKNIQEQDFSSLIKGIYFLKLENSNSSFITFKIIKN